MLKFLTASQIIKIHDDIICEFGGGNGLRSKELLESASYRMKASFEGKDLYPGVFDKAACLLDSIAKNHAFIDGNKRTAFVSSVTFLGINGYDTDFDSVKTEEFILDMVKGKKNFNQIADFLKRHSRKRA